MENKQNIKLSNTDFNYTRSIQIRSLYKSLYSNKNHHKQIINLISKSFSSKKKKVKPIIQEEIVQQSKKNKKIATQNLLNLAKQDCFKLFVGTDLKKFVIQTKLIIGLSLFLLYNVYKYSKFVRVAPKLVENMNLKQIFDEDEIQIAYEYESKRSAINLVLLHSSMIVLGFFVYYFNSITKNFVFRAYYSISQECLIFEKLSYGLIRVENVVEIKNLRRLNYQAPFNLSNNYFNKSNYEFYSIYPQKIKYMEGISDEYKIENLVSQQIEYPLKDSNYNNNEDSNNFANSCFEGFNFNKKVLILWFLFCCLELFYLQYIIKEYNSKEARSLLNMKNFSERYQEKRQMLLENKRLQKLNKEINQKVEESKNI